MCKFNIVDVLAIQECMDGYKKLIEWMPTIDEVEDELKEHRLKVIDRISTLCDEAIDSERGKRLFGYSDGK